MNNNWKPGDVALVNGHVAFVWADEMFVYTDADGDAVSTWLVGSDARRLVVIDPEDREQVERLESGVAAQMGWKRLDGTQRIDATQAALREFASPTPPKPAWTDGDVVLTGPRAYHRHAGEWHGTRAANEAYSDVDIDRSVELGATILRRQSDEVTP